MMATAPNIFEVAVPAGAYLRHDMRPLGRNIPPTEPAGRARPREMTVSPMPNAAGRIRRHDPGCFPHASPASTLRAGKQKTAP